MSDWTKRSASADQSQVIEKIRRGSAWVTTQSMVTRSRGGVVKNLTENYFLD